MSAQQLQHSNYGFSKTVDLPYKEAVEKARAALDAKTMLSAAGANNATINAVASEVNEKLSRVVAQL